MWQCVVDLITGVWMLQWLPLTVLVRRSRIKHFYELRKQVLGDSLLKPLYLALGVSQVMYTVCSDLVKSP